MASQRHTRRGLITTLLLILLCRVATPAAHERRTVGQLQLTIGWGDEPVFSGSRNAVEVRVADSSGAAVNDPEAALTVDVSFGEARTTVPLRRTREPGTFKGWLLPNRPGTYTFHITGRVRQQPVDVTSTCSETTFDCVNDVAAIQFPAQDPTLGQLADRVTRSLPRGERAAETGLTTRSIAMAGLVLAGLALATTVVAGVRKRH
jgi:hypothetical protein